jgi:hypothetical protein
MLRRRPDSTFEYREIERALYASAPNALTPERKEALRLRIFSQLGAQDEARPAPTGIARERWITIPVGVGIAAAVLAGTRYVLDQRGPAGNDTLVAMASGAVTIDGASGASAGAGQRIAATGPSWVAVGENVRVGLEHGAAFRFATSGDRLALLLESGRHHIVSNEPLLEVRGGRWAAHLTGPGVLEVNIHQWYTSIEAIEGEAVVHHAGTAFLLRAGDPPLLVMNGPAGDAGNGAPDASDGHPAGSGDQGPGGPGGAPHVAGVSADDRAGGTSSTPSSGAGGLAAGAPPVAAPPAAGSGTPTGVITTPPDVPAGQPTGVPPAEVPPARTPPVDPPAGQGPAVDPPGQGHAGDPPAGDPPGNPAQGGDPPGQGDTPGQGQQPDPPGGGGSTGRGSEHPQHPLGGPPGKADEKQSEGEGQGQGSQGQTAAGSGTNEAPGGEGDAAGGSKAAAQGQEARSGAPGQQRRK